MRSKRNLLYLFCVAYFSHASLLSATDVSGTISSPATWKKAKSPIVVVGNVTVSGTTLTIEAGVVVNVNQGFSITVQNSGTITAVGTSSSHITFQGTSRSAGYWNGIVLASGATSNFAFTDFADATTAITSFAGITAHHSAFSNNSLRAVQVTGPSTAAFYANNFTGGGETNTVTAAGNEVNAKLCWWGSATGPSGSGPGTGQAVSAGINYEPWLISTYTTANYFNSFTVSNRTFNPLIGVNTALTFATQVSASWTVTITNASNQVVRTFTGSGASATVTWDGKNGSGVVQPAGTYTFQADSFSATSVKGKVIIDTNRQFTITGLAVTPQFFNPNTATTRIGATISFDGANWTLNIKNASGSVIRSTKGTGSNVLFLWNGKNSGGVLQPDGIYTIELAATLSPLSPLTATTISTIDTVLPQASFAAPANNATIYTFQQSVPFNITFTGTASDSNIANWYLESAPGNPPGTFKQIATGNTSLINTTIANWDVRNVTNGIYTIRLRVVDKAANISIVSIVITLWNFSLQQNGITEFDSRTGNITYTSVLSTSVTQSLVIKNEQGAVVRTLVNGVRSAGTYNDIWNGRNDSGALLPDGAYFIVGTVSNGSASAIYDATNQVDDWRTAPYYWQYPTLGSYDPFKNSPLVITYNWPRTSRNIVAFAPYEAGYKIIAMSCDPPQFCLVNMKYEEAGPHTVTWAGVDDTGVLRTDIKWMATISYTINIPPNAVVLFGTKPSISNYALSPINYVPNLGNETVSFALSTNQNQPATIKVSYTNMESLSTLRTITQTGVLPGNVTIQWNGRADNGDFVAPGNYVVTVRVIDSIGNEIVQKLLTVVSY